MISLTLGNGSPGFADGTKLTIIDLIGAQGGQPRRSKAGIGNELFGPSFAASWTFNYGAIAEAT